MFITKVEGKNWVNLRHRLFKYKASTLKKARANGKGSNTLHYACIVYLLLYSLNGLAHLFFFVYSESKGGRY